MNRLNFLLPLFLLSSLFSKAQDITHITLSSDGSEMFMVQDLQNTYISIETDLADPQNFDVSGYYDAVMVTITAKDGFYIALKEPNSFNAATMGGGGGTTIKSKPPGVIPCPNGDCRTLIIYPNPVQTELTFESTNTKMKAFNIYDLGGTVRMAQNITPPDNKYTINVSNLTAGNYILQLITENNISQSLQFIKN